MKFLKGAMIGALIGTTAIMLKEGDLNSIIKKGKKKIKKFRRICMI